jgi:hypothetical protein
MKYCSNEIIWEFGDVGIWRCGDLRMGRFGNEN